MSGDPLRAAVSATVMVATHTLRVPVAYLRRIPIRAYIPIGVSMMNLGVWSVLVMIHGLRLVDLVAVLVINVGLGVAGGTVYGLLRGALAVLERRVSDVRQAQEQHAAAMDFVLGTTRNRGGRGWETYQ
jgi:hypothetical protein